MSWGEWFNTIGGGVTMLGVWITLAALIIGGWSSRTAKRLQADIHLATQTTLADLAKGFRESQHVLSENSKTIAQSVGELGKILERMDQRTAQIQARQEDMDQRWQQAFERMDQRADERHRETLQVIQALQR